jgi:hypothetical protein
VNAADRHQLTHLDRAIARLLDERARLARGAGGPLCAPAIDDVLGRSSGDFPAASLRAVFDAVEAGCREVSPEEPRR